MRLRRQAAAVGREQLFEIGDAPLHIRAAVGIAHAKPVGILLDHDRPGRARPRFRARGVRVEGLVLGEIQLVRGIHQRVAADARYGLVRLREAAVDVDELPLALMGVSPFVLRTGTWPLMMWPRSKSRRTR